jgi:hypothetical protein
MTDLTWLAIVAGLFLLTNGLHAAVRQGLR